MLSSVWTWLAVSSPTTSRRSSLSVVTLSPPLLSVKLTVTSRRNSVMLPLTSNKKWLLLLPPPPWKSLMNFPMAKSSPLAMRDSVPLRPSSNPHSWEWNPAVSMRPPTTPSLNVMLTSVRTCMPTLSCLVAPPCTLVLLTECKRKSPPWLHPPLRSRSLLPLRGNTPSGSVAPSWLPSPPSNRCGSPNKSTMNAVHPLSTGNASKQFLLLCHITMLKQVQSYISMVLKNIPTDVLTTYYILFKIGNSIKLLCTTFWLLAFYNFCNNT